MGVSKVRRRIQHGFQCGANSNNDSDVRNKADFVFPDEHSRCDLEVFVQSENFRCDVLYHWV